MRLTIRSLARAAFAFGTLLIVALSLMPISQVGAPTASDKYAHFAAYATLALAAGFAFATTAGKARASLFAVILGVALEFGQGLIPNRDPSLWDAVANTGGVAAGLIVAVTALRLMRPPVQPADRESATFGCDTKDTS